MLPVSILSVPGASPLPAPAGALLDAISRHAGRQPQVIAIRSACRTINYGALNMMIDSLADRFSRMGTSILGIYSDNSLDWILADLAALRARITIAAIPASLTGPRLCHALRQADINWILTDRSTDFAELSGLTTTEYRPLLNTLDALRVGRMSGAPRHTEAGSKIYYRTDPGSQPCGIELTSQGIDQAALSLREAMQATPADRHLCLLPLHSAIGCIAGIYVALLGGSTCIVPPLARMPSPEETTWNGHHLLDLLEKHQASTTLLTSSMLAAIVPALRHRGRVPSALRQAHVVGHTASPDLVAAASRLGLPVYAAYGFTECGSLVALNRPGANLPGSVGKPLPHIRIEIAGNGELLIHGTPFHGYLDHPPAQKNATAPFRTGEVGHFDRNGYLYLQPPREHPLNNDQPSPQKRASAGDRSSDAIKASV